MGQRVHEVDIASPADFLAVAQLDRIAWGDDTFIVDGEHVWRVWCEHATVLVIRKEPEAAANPNTADEIAAALVQFPTHDGKLFLHKIMVAPSWRGHGMGTALMTAALARADAPVLLTVDPQNEAAIELYRKYGFTLHRYIEGYYRPHEHRYLMIHHLD